MSMVEFQPVAIAIVAVIFFLVRYFNRTDIPKIKNLPEIPGIPIFGNLIQLGDEHARNARQWVAKYGGVFQVRMGNKVCKYPRGYSTSFGWFAQVHSKLVRERNG